MTHVAPLAKSLTGISGLDAITFGGLPTGRPTLICGSAGSGKTMFGAEFLVRGATEFGENGVLVMFEESAVEIATNMRSLGFDLDGLVIQGKIVLDHVHVERSEIEETGEYDLEGLFIRLGYAIDSIGAKRIVLDTLEALFSGLQNQAILRSELRRLFRWLKDRGVTAVITAERGSRDTLSRYGLEEFVADCVIVLDHRMIEQVSTRRLRILKYRGSAHGTNEYPFLISSRGISVLPITSLGLDHSASDERVSSGIPAVDEMIGGSGFYRGSSVLVSGSSGTGKSSFAASAVHAACARGERAMLFAYEESEAQIVRNMRSIGLDLEPWIAAGLLRIHASRPTLFGLEEHLVLMHDTVKAFSPSLVAVDPVSNLSLSSDEHELRPTLMRLIDFLKAERITAIFLSLTSGIDAASESSQAGMSSLMDAWLLLRNTEEKGERNRTLYVLKARGLAHSNQVREFVITSSGIEVRAPGEGTSRGLVGSSRDAHAERASIAAAVQLDEQQRRLRVHTGRIRALDAQIEMLQAQLAAERLDQYDGATDMRDYMGNVPDSGARTMAPGGVEQS